MNTADTPKFRRYPAGERAAMLIRAGLACLAEGGITALTVDNVCRRADVSRGLISHHFGSKEGLLAAVYEAAYQPMLAVIDPVDGPLPLGPLIARMIGGEGVDPATLRIWLALWGEVAVNPALQAAHRQNYGRYRAIVQRAIEARDMRLDAGNLATSVIALVDGLWLEQCLDPDAFDGARARLACRALLEPLLGRLDDL